MQSFKVIERTPNFDNGRTDGLTHARTGVTLSAPPQFFEWRGHNKIQRLIHHQSEHVYTYDMKRKQAYYYVRHCISSTETCTHKYLKSTLSARNIANTTELNTRNQSLLNTV